jgi:hypothetical protein
MRIANARNGQRKRTVASCERYTLDLYAYINSARRRSSASSSSLLLLIFKGIRQSFMSEASSVFIKIQFDDRRTRCSASPNSAQNKYKKPRTMSVASAVLSNIGRLERPLGSTHVRKNVTEKADVLSAV